MSQASAGEVRPLYVGQYPCRITVTRHGSQWVAVAELTTAEGPVRFAASADEDVIARSLARHVAVAGFDLGRVFGQVAQGARQLAQSRSVRDVMRTVSDVVREPVITEAIAIIPGVGPVASSTLRAAGTLLDRSQEGDRRALSNLGAIATAARRGNPLAGRAMQVLATTHRAQRRTTEDRFRARGPTVVSNRPAAAAQQSPDLGSLLGSLLGVASSVASAASSQGAAQGAPAGVAASGARSADESWRSTRPEERTPAQHRAAYQAAIAAGLGEAYREAATAGAWEGARWMWRSSVEAPRLGAGAS